jgi:hypothetical protein
MTYNGWANYHTWNVALWISNEEPLYRAAVEYAESADSPTYGDYIAIWMGGDWGDVTPDGVSWTDPTLDHDELDAFMRELAE